jgi:outer membrane protein assembly factor BamB
MLKNRHSHFTERQVLSEVKYYYEGQDTNADLTYIGKYWENPKDFDVRADYAEHWQFQSDEAIYDLIVLDRDGEIVIGTDNDYVNLYEGR